MAETATSVSEPDLMTVKCDPRHGKHVTCCLMYRPGGDDQGKAHNSPCELVARGFQVRNQSRRRSGGGWRSRQQSLGRSRAVSGRSGLRSVRRRSPHHHRLQRGLDDGPVRGGHSLTQYQGSVSLPQSHSEFELCSSSARALFGSLHRHSDAPQFVRLEDFFFATAPQWMGKV